MLGLSFLGEVQVKESLAKESANLTDLGDLGDVNLHELFER
jgi:hypothetical protein